MSAWWVLPVAVVLALLWFDVGRIRRQSALHTQALLDLDDDLDEVRRDLADARSGGAA